MEPAPIAIFAYNRVDHLKRLIESLKCNALSKDSILYIFCDGPKVNNDLSVQKVRSYVRSIEGFKNIITVYSNENKGLAKSIISGINHVFQKHKTIIVLEDDLSVSEDFLEYMNYTLKFFRDNSNIGSIHGYVYPIENLPDYFFLKGADCWGWATWKEKWGFFEENGNLLLSSIEALQLKDSFDYNGAYPFYRMLQNQVKGKNNSWAIRWHASCYLNNLLTLYPGKSFISNHGFDESGTHCNDAQTYRTDNQQGYFEKTKNSLKTIKIEINSKAFSQFESFFRSNYNKTIVDLIDSLRLGFEKLQLQFLKVIFGLKNKVLSKTNFINLKIVSSWEEAKLNSNGYNSEKLIAKINRASKYHRSKFAIFEKDGVLTFSKKDSLFLSRIIKRDITIQRVIDFGGSTGTTYFQIKTINKNRKFDWIIVEQPILALNINNNFYPNELNFKTNLNGPLGEIDLVYFGSSFQYLENYENIFEIIFNIKPKYIVLARTPFSNSKEFIGIQYGRINLNSFSYPIRLNDLKKLKELIINNNYKLTHSESEKDYIGEKVIVKSLCFKLK